MSRKPKPTTILGPDGKPLDLDKLRTERHDAAASERKVRGVVPSVTVKDEVHTFTLDMSKWLTAEAMTFRPFADGVIGHTAKRAPKPKPLAERVAADVEALTADLDFAGRPELPQPTPDLTAYADAFDVAIRSCPHADVEDTIHSRGEYQCQDCGRYLSREDMRRRADANPWGRWFR